MNSRLRLTFESPDIKPKFLDFLEPECYQARCIALRNAVSFFSDS